MTEATKNDLIDKMSELSLEAQEHFEKIIDILARCYLPDFESRGMLIVYEDGLMHMLSLGANDEEMFDMCRIAQKVTERAVGAGDEAVH